MSRILNIAHIAHTTCGIGISNMPENFQKVNCSIGYEASGMGEDTGLCGIDPDDDTRGKGAIFLGRRCWPGKWGHDKNPRNPILLLMLKSRTSW